ncbi:phage tail sheath subtilisin-like domain-containing protein [Rhodobacter capsulatus]|uniref:Phage tail protein n=1 Tax=Rhodobacter capsulatus TaxID=1061 RepID=A0A1G7PXY9_RHOCA|nr:phage tail sheath subtilisin-like domain-containing protein [Rhodobacter capsulatus]WER10172.1 phage tail sheath subtilisin-like domain-containing protein [Rhodobacter capsulatus]SDF90240.1 hypothetical protein SAMN04244550_03062 [Rhodobacter capsulatus]
MAYLHGVETVEVTNGARPVEVVRSSVIGIVGTAPDADPEKWPLNTPVLTIGGAESVSDLGATGTLADAFDALFAQGVGLTVITVRVEEGAAIADTLSNVVGDVSERTGVNALWSAQALFGVSPRILIAPGFTSQRPSNLANPVVGAMQGFADRRRAVIIADGPNTTKEAAYTYRQDWGSDRIYIVDPGVTVYEGGETVVRPASAYVAGLIARVDRDEGYHYSPSNHEIYGITGTARPIDHFLGDPDTEANYLNEQRIATIVRDQGLRLWGNETTSVEPLNKFLSVRRTHDVVADSIQAAHLWAVDKPFSLQLLVDIAETVNGFLRQMTALGRLLGGRVWLDPAKNTKETWVAGHLYVDYDAEAPAPMQRITFYFNRNTGYYDTLSAKAVAEIARLTA